MKWEIISWLFLYAIAGVRVLKIDDTCPLSGSEHNLSTQPAAQPRPFLPIGPKI